VEFLNHLFSFVMSFVTAFGLLAGIVGPEHVDDESPLGRLGHVIPREFEEGGTKPAYVRISRDQYSDLFASLPPDAQAEFKAIEIDDVMKVNLVSSPSNAFDIVPLSEDEQLLPIAGSAQWEWDLIAKSPGTHEIILSASLVLIDRYGNKHRRTEEIFRQKVEISVLPFPKRILRVLSDNWQLLVTTAVGLMTVAVGVPSAWIAYRQWKDGHQGGGAKGSRVAADSAQSQQGVDAGAKDGGAAHQGFGGVAADDPGQTRPGPEGGRATHQGVTARGGGSPDEGAA
jgi:hypothetical protein